ncbi:MAG: hypothetical protein HKO92_11835 [Flavobacteriaceae bacterium]|nr:hypothetical protein [Flavobacteriaceae bacterium]
MKKLLIIILICACILSCEKDDICEEGAAVIPQLIITFYDYTSPEDKKEVDNLLVFGVDDENEVVLFTNSVVTTTDSIAFPLRTDSDITKIVFHKDYEIDDNDTPEDTNDDILLGNQDLVNVSYLREPIYISRACGYIYNYSDLNSSIETDTNNWILDTDIINSIIENETAAHVKIYH